MAFTQDLETLVPLPISGPEYADFIAAKGLTTAAPSLLYRLNETTGVLAPSIGAGDFAGAGARVYDQDVVGWAKNGVQLSVDSAFWAGPAHANHLTVAQTTFLIADLGAAEVGANRDLYCADSTGAGSTTSIRRAFDGTIVLVRGANSVASALPYTGVVGMLLVVDNATSTCKLYLRGLTGSIEVLTPTYTSPVNAGSQVFLASGFLQSAITVRAMWLEIWSGADAAAFTPTAAAAFLTAHMSAYTATETTPASLGGIMTILLLAQRGTRHERQLVYGKKHPMRRK